MRAAEPNCQQHAAGTGVDGLSRGLDHFSEHTRDARAHPGHHPNIDRLLAVIASGEGFAAKLIKTRFSAYRPAADVGRYKFSSCLRTFHKG